MKKLLFLIGLVIAFFIVSRGGYDSTPENATATEIDTQQIKAAFDNQQSDVQVAGEGIVSRLLSDDNEGSRHQRFIVELSSGQTVLISHNIDLAPRIDALRQGDTVRFYGEYEWNPQGGVVHWTHLDPAGRHAHGWIEHEGKRYE
ncbi:MAG: DUF3465 domain-containing protein [Rhodothermales bacterium]